MFVIKSKIRDDIMTSKTYHDINKVRYNIKNTF